MNHRITVDNNSVMFIQEVLHNEFFFIRADEA